MRYAQIRSMDISNGEGIGVSLFVQGCHFHCYNCFNQETWDFNSGKEWTRQIERHFLDLVNKAYIKRVSILGGEPLCDENVRTVLKLITKINNNFNDKKIWLYTGYTWEEIMRSRNAFVKDKMLSLRQLAICESDILVDGKYIDSLKNYSLKFRGSSNQRVIDVQKTLSECNKTHELKLLYV